MDRVVLGKNEGKYEAAILLVAAGEHTIEEIAAILKISPTTLTTWRRQKSFQEGIKQEIRARLGGTVGRALDNIEKLANEAKSENVKLNANKELLEKYGITSKQEINMATKQDIVVELFDSEQEKEEE